MFLQEMWCSIYSIGESRLYAIRVLLNSFISIRVFASQPGAWWTTATRPGWHCAFGFRRTPIIIVSRGNAIAPSFHLRFL